MTEQNQFAATGAPGSDFGFGKRMAGGTTDWTPPAPPTPSTHTNNPAVAPQEPAFTTSAAYPEAPADLEAPAEFAQAQPAMAPVQEAQPEPAPVAADATAPAAVDAPNGYQAPTFHDRFPNGVPGPIELPPVTGEEIATEAAPAVEQAFAAPEAATPEPTFEAAPEAPITEAAPAALPAFTQMQASPPAAAEEPAAAEAETPAPEAGQAMPDNAEIWELIPAEDKAQMGIDPTIAYADLPEELRNQIDAMTPQTVEEAQAMIAAASGTETAQAAPEEEASQQTDGPRETSIDGMLDVLSDESFTNVGTKTRIQASALKTLLDHGRNGDENDQEKLMTDGFELIEKIADGLDAVSAPAETKGRFVEAAAALIDSDAVSPVDLYKRTQTMAANQEASALGIIAQTGVKAAEQREKMSQQAAANSSSPLPPQGEGKWTDKAREYDENGVQKGPGPTYL